MYLIGASHPNKTRAIELVNRLVRAGERLVTDIEVYQEILHRYTAIRRTDAIDVAFRSLDTIADEVLTFGDAGDTRGQVNHRCRRWGLGPRRPSRGDHAKQPHRSDSELRSRIRRIPRARSTALTRIVLPRSPSTRAARRAPVNGHPSVHPQHAYWRSLESSCDPDQTGVADFAAYDETDEDWPVIDGHGAPRCRVGSRRPRHPRRNGATRRHHPRRCGGGDAARHHRRPHRAHHGVHRRARSRPHRLRARASVLEDDGGAGSAPGRPQQDRDPAEPRIPCPSRFAIPDRDDARTRRFPSP